MALTRRESLLSAFSNSGRPLSRLAFLFALFLIHSTYYIVFGLSRNVETELVKFESEKEVKSFVINEQFKEQLLQGRYTTELVQTGSPTVKIYRADDTGKKLAGKENFIMQIRYKLEVASSSSQGTKVYKFYPRHYLEAQPGMFSL